MIEIDLTRISGLLIFIYLPLLQGRVWQAVENPFQGIGAVITTVRHFRCSASYPRPIKSVLCWSSSWHLQSISRAENLMQAQIFVLQPCSMIGLVIGQKPHHDVPCVMDQFMVVAACESLIVVAMSVDITILNTK